MTEDVETGRRGEASEFPRDAQVRRYAHIERLSHDVDERRPDRRARGGWIEPQPPQLRQRHMLIEAHAGLEALQRNAALPVRPLEREGGARGVQLEHLQREERRENSSGR